MAIKNAFAPKKQGKTNRKGIHAKTKSSVNKLSKYYKKLSRGQG